MIPSLHPSRIFSVVYCERTIEPIVLDEEGEVVNNTSERCVEVTMIFPGRNPPPHPEQCEILHIYCAGSLFTLTRAYLISPLSSSESRLPAECGLVYTGIKYFTNHK